MKGLLFGLVALLVTAAILTGSAHAQYSPVPDFSGIGAGFNFRQAINARFSGATPIAPQIVAFSYAGLPSERDGDLFWCKDCLRATPCASGGAGAWALGTRGQWSCGYPTLEADLNAGGHSVTGALSVQTANGAVETKNTADTNWRELLTPGTGVQVSNGTAAPYLAIDESANVSGHVNGVINVKAPPYLAKGDGATDDTAAIQAAINASCAQSGAKQPVLLPPTPGGKSYLISSPILLPCAAAFGGQPGTSLTGSAAITQNYIGPTILMQAAETGWKPPLASSVAAPWTASHSYAQWIEILDSNGSVEVQTASSCTSGSGSHPTWPLTQGGTATDNTCTWQLAMVGTQLASGAGSALDALSPEMWPGAGFGSNMAGIEIDRWSGVNDAMLNGLTSFTWEFYANVLDHAGGGADTGPQIRTEDPNLQHSPIEVVEVDSQGSCPFNCIAAILYIGGSRIALVPTTANAQATAGITHHIAVSCGAGTCGLYLDGVQLKTASYSGGLTYYPYSQVFLSETPGNGGPHAYYDSFRISNTARYTSNFTAPTAKLTSDANTLFLENYPAGAPTGTLVGTNVWKSKTAYVPVETSAGGAIITPGYVGHLTIPSGIVANWVLNSTIENIIQQNGSPTCLELNDNDFQDTVRRFYCSVVPNSTPTSIGFYFGNQSNNNLYDHLQCDGQQTCIEEYGGSGTYILPDFTDRGQAVYPFAFIQAQALLDSPTTDIEDSALNFLADIYASGNYAPLEVHGGQLFSGASSGAYLAIKAGAPIVDTATLFSGTTSEAANVISNPTSPVTFRDASLPSGVALSNSGKSYWVKADQNGQDIGMQFADLPACTSGLNGTLRFLSDGTIGATCAGSGSGAFAKCLGTTWVCN